MTIPPKFYKIGIDTRYIACYNKHIIRDISRVITHKGDGDSEYETNEIAKGA